MKTARNILFGLIVVIALNFLGSYVITNHFIIKSYPRSTSKHDARARGVMLNDSLTFAVKGDSLKNFDREFDVWIEEFVVENGFGMFPISYETKNSDRVVFNIQPLVVRRNWLISFDGGEKLSLRNVVSHPIDHRDSIEIRFYHNDRTNLTEIGSILVHP